MQEIAATTVNIPVDRVWEVLADHEGMSHWAPGQKAVLITPGQTDRNGVGAVRRIKRPGLPAVVEEVTGFEPGRLLAYKLISGLPFRNYHAQVTLALDSEGTHIRWAANADRRIPLVDRIGMRLIVRTLLRSLVRVAGEARR
jgi:uncharacterized protein YndB with AHSA1/START domain